MSLDEWHLQLEINVIPQGLGSRDIFLMGRGGHCSGGLSWIPMDADLPSVIPFNPSSFSLISPLPLQPLSAEMLSSTFGSRLSNVPVAVPCQVDVAVTPACYQ